MCFNVVIVYIDYNMTILIEFSALNPLIYN